MLQVSKFIYIILLRILITFFIILKYAIDVDGKGKLYCFVSSTFYLEIEVISLLTTNWPEKTGAKQYIQNVTGNIFLIGTLVKS